DEAQCNRTDAVAVKLVVVEMLHHCRPKRGEPFPETDQPLELGAVLFGAVIRVVDVLLPTRLVEAGRLELRARARRDPNVFPRRRNRESLDALDRRRVANLATAPVEIAKRSLATGPGRHFPRSTHPPWPP